MTRIDIELDQDLLEHLEAAAAKRGMTVEEIVPMLLDHQVEAHASAA